MTFYLGTHRPAWLSRSVAPLFVSARTLRRVRRPRRAACRWALDSGGFTELSMHGRWTISAAQYAREVRRLGTLIGRMDWAAPQDWMCEPAIRARTGMSVRDHQRRTVDNFVELTEIAPRLPIIPVLQGWEERDYHRCVELYDAAGVDLRAAPAVGVGTVCRRQRTREGVEIIASLARYGLRLHGFGVKTSALRRLPRGALASADSMAWSLRARYDAPLPGHQHRNCANCYEYAMRWRGKIMTLLRERRLS